MKYAEGKPISYQNLKPSAKKKNLKSGKNI